MVKKLKKILLPILTGFLLFGCSTTYYNYIQETKNTHRFYNGREMIEMDLAPLIFDVESSDKISISFSFSENLIKAQTLKSIDLKFYSKEANGSQYTKEIPITKSSMTVEYWDGKNIIKKTKNNYSENLYSLIDYSMNQVKYKDSNIVTFNLENSYKPDGLPETIEQKITIQWKDKAPDIYTNILTKKKTTKPFISGRPFG